MLAQPNRSPTSRWTQYTRRLRVYCVQRLLKLPLQNHARAAARLARSLQRTQSPMQWCREQRLGLITRSWLMRWRCSRQVAKPRGMCEDQQIQMHCRSSFGVWDLLSRLSHRSHLLMDNVQYDCIRCAWTSLDLNFSPNTNSAKYRGIVTRRIRASHPTRGTPCYKSTMSLTIFDLYFMSLSNL